MLMLLILSTDPLRGRGPAVYRPHRECVAPNDPNIPIWRYMDFAKFVDLLERKQLHFARLDQLGDPFEGAPSDGTMALLRAWEERHSVQAVSGEPSWKIQARDTYLMNSLIMYVNCWHMNEHESQAMWRMYSREGIAIRSTYQRLVESFVGDDGDVHVGQVFYRDHRAPLEPENPGNTLAPVLRKRMSYDYERELRAITDRIPPEWTSGSFPYDAYRDNQPKGVTLDVDLDVLLERVYVAPGRPGWFKALVTSVMATYQLDKPIETSSLDERPDVV